MEGSKEETKLIFCKADTLKEAITETNSSLEKVGLSVSEKDFFTKEELKTWDIYSNLFIFKTDFPAASLFKTDVDWEFDDEQENLPVSEQIRLHSVITVWAEELHKDGCIGERWEAFLYNDPCLCFMSEDEMMGEAISALYHYSSQELLDVYEQNDIKRWESEKLEKGWRFTTRQINIPITVTGFMSGDVSDEKLTSVIKQMIPSKISL